MPRKGVKKLFAHNAEGCTGTPVEEYPGAFHCPSCGAWQRLNEVEMVA